MEPSEKKRTLLNKILSRSCIEILKLVFREINPENHFFFW